jgi:hypothetical protein
MTDPMQNSDAFAAVAGLIALITDAKGCAKRLAELQQQIDVATKAQSKLDSERVVHDRAVAAAEVEMIARETAVRKREVTVSIAARDLIEREKIVAASKPDRYPQDPNFHGSIRQEPYTNG